MKRVYKNQTKLRFILNTACDLKGWNTIEVRYRKPDGESGVFNGGVLDETKGIIYYDIQTKTDLDQVGIWTIWSYVLFDDDRNAFGRPEKICVCSEGN